MSQVAEAVGLYPVRLLPDDRTFLVKPGEDVLTAGLRQGIDLEEVAAYLGRDLPMPSFLVTLSAYFGQINVGDSVLVVSPVTGDVAGR